jgi:hypothetical protein
MLTDDGYICVCCEMAVNNDFKFALIGDVSLNHMVVLQNTECGSGGTTS